ncbi:MAG: hypothetical protein MZW92_16890 [Comamonadaceae bacterium]|nr:hypothetical protein [Comamonadaceae bacterium]
MGLGGLFDVVMTSEETGYLKPEPEPVARSWPPGSGWSPGTCCTSAIPRPTTWRGQGGGRRQRPHPVFPGGRVSGGADFSFRRYGELARWIPVRPLTAALNPARPPPHAGSPQALHHLRKGAADPRMGPHRDLPAASRHVEHHGTGTRGLEEGVPEVRRGPPPPADPEPAADAPAW